MPENIKLTREQTISLVFISTFGNMVYSHTWIDDDTDRAAWVAAAAGILLLIPFAVWIMQLGKKYPGESVFDIFETNLGKITGYLVRTVYIGINIAVAVAILNMFTQLLKTFFNLYTPLWIIMLFLVMVSVIIISGGFVTFSRLVELLTGLGMINYFISFSFAFPQYIHPEYIFPVFDTSLAGFLQGTVFITGAAAECLLLLMIIVSYIPDPGKHYWWVIKGLIICAVVFPSAILIIMAMISPELAKRIAFGGVNAAKIVQVGEFVRGLEVFMFSTYQFITIGKISLCLYCAWTSTQKMFNNWKPGLQLILLAAIILAASLWLSSYIRAYQLAVLLGRYVLLPFTTAILVLTSLGIWLARKNPGGAAK